MFLQNFPEIIESSQSANASNAIANSASGWGTSFAIHGSLLLGLLLTGAAAEYQIPALTLRQGESSLEIECTLESAASEQAFAEVRKPIVAPEISEGEDYMQTVEYPLTDDSFLEVELPELSIPMPAEDLPQADPEPAKELEQAPVAEEPSLELAENANDSPSTEAASASNAADGSKVDSYPEPLHTNVAPNYPEKAMLNGLEGRTILWVRVSSDGSVESIRVEKSSGHKLLDDAAIESVKKWLFRPAMRKQLPVPYAIEVPLRFMLHTTDAASS